MASERKFRCEVILTPTALVDNLSTTPGRLCASGVPILRIRGSNTMADAVSLSVIGGMNPSSISLKIWEGAQLLNTRLTALIMTGITNRVTVVGQRARFNRTIAARTSRTTNSLPGKGRHFIKTGGVTFSEFQLALSTTGLSSVGVLNGQ